VFFKMAPSGYSAAGCADYSFGRCPFLFNHNAIDPAYGDRISTTYQQFYETELHTLRMTDEDIEGIRMGGGG
jgi:hypothetical protein